MNAKKSAKSRRKNGDAEVGAGSERPPTITEPEFVEPSSELVELARAYGVAIDYWDQGGTYHRTSATVLLAVLSAMGVDASSPDAIWHSLVDRRNEPWKRMLPPVYVARQGTDNECWVHVPDGDPVSLWVDLEAGGDAWYFHQIDRYIEPRHVDGVLVGEATFHIPGDLPLGYHTMWARSEGADGVVREQSCPLVVTPQRLDPPALEGGRQWGFMTQVYAMRSRASWGVGDLLDLADLAAWSGHDEGADFVLVNPMHATSPSAPMEASPYLPATRRFANPLYLRPEAIQEYGQLGPERRARIDELAKPMRKLSASPDLIDRDVIWKAKSKALRIIYEAGRTPGREALLDAFIAREGQVLIDFTTWCALVDQHGNPSGWPESLQDPGSPQVTAERERLAESIRWHQWLQWQLDQQMALAQQAAVDAGMRSGVVHDLAVGVHAQGSDAWALRDVLATGIAVGAPPDMFNQKGQNWSQPPWLPDALAEAGFAPYRDMLRAILRHAGGVRVDHILGLFRFWWVPDGMPATEGTFVTSDHEALVGILALEAHRAGAWVVGEDLGTLEQWVKDYLATRGILGTSILWFERDYDVSPDVPRPVEDWRAGALASVTVHDMPPTAGFLEGAHVKLRDELGLLNRPVEEELADTQAQIAEWRAVCVDRGWMAADGSDEDLAVALHKLLATTPSRLLGIALTDAVGDRRIQNQPGTEREYPNWRVPLTGARGKSVLIDDFPDMAILHRFVDAVRQAMEP